MTQTKTKIPPSTYAIIVWMTINILLMITLIASGDVEDLNNWIEIPLWTISIVGLLSTRKWGAAFAIFTLCYTFSTSMSIVIYYQIWLNTIRVIINAAIIIHMFRALVADKLQ